jgi:glutathione peroxidase
VLFAGKTTGSVFCSAKKGSVIKGNEQQPVYQWLTDKRKNGWNSKSPSWNFSKYLINEDGTLMHYFGPSIEPDSEAIEEALK